MSTTEIRDAEVKSSLYAPRRNIYPKHVEGTFRRIKWGLLAFVLAVYYLLPFVRWDRGPNAPNQAVLVDFPHRRFYFFFIEIWPQEVYYLTGLLILAALVLFLMNALAGRIWCGYLCPQTVWTDLYLLAERWIEGEARERARKDAGPLTPQIIREKIAKHFVWLLIAWWTGGAWVLYFADAPTLVWRLATFQPGVSEAYMWIGIFTFTTYMLAGHMREQVCLYMCPWPRIQASLTDEYALNVTYRYDRGEPRSSLKQAAALRAQGAPAGDCVDCGQCVAACPTGVDIRRGASLGCIQCGLCIDACDAVMTKIGRPPRLIGYDTQMNVERRLRGEAPVYRMLRPRTILYAALILAIGGLMSLNLAMRDDARLSVIHDRNPLTVRLADGSVRNAYTVRFANMSAEPKRFVLEMSGVEDAEVEIVGVEPDAEGRFVVEVGPDQTREARVLVTVRGARAPAGQVPVSFTSRDLDTETLVDAKDVFVWP
jgi:cytochrome c oxidase accessory protein FixG